MKKIYGSFLLAMILAVSGFCYRFVCNGLLANGEERKDECGICDDEHAARWENPNISVLVDTSSLPPTINKQDWQTAIKNSFAAWESISGSSLRFVQTNDQSVRQFGADEASHEIFWITDKQEWRKMVGSGEFGTLGATLPRYKCGGALGAKRVIFDADLVLNGLPHINWQLECHDEDCISVQTTLVHELGHFFGLDHPCMMCSTSIMSARAGFDLIYPVIDDMEGLRVLYPDGKTGGFAMPCTRDSDCASEHHCINDKRDRYCSKECRNDRECSLGAACKTKDGNKVCSIIKSEMANFKKEGENCMRTPCAEPMLCAGASEPNFYCYLPCKNARDCKLNQDCITLNEDRSICVAVKKLRERCDHRDLCMDGLLCVFDTLKSGFCRSPCTRSLGSTGCSSDEVCEMLEGIEICLPKDGDLMLDESSDEFERKENDGLLGRTQLSKKPVAETPFGCQNGANLLNDVSMLVLAFLCMVKRSKVICLKLNEKRNLS